MGGANIENVDYDAIPGQASEIREEAKVLNSEITSAYKKIEDMHNSWYGDRYNELVKAFNEMIPQLNSMLNLVVTEIPFALETIANNYAELDRGTKVCTPNNEGPTVLESITVISDDGLRFITSEVASTKSEVSTNLKNSKDQMDEIELTYNNIDWSSNASEEFKAKFTKLKSSIVASFDNIESQFAELMSQAEEDVEKAEKANTLN